MGHSLYAEGSGWSGQGDRPTTESGGGSDPRGSLHRRGEGSGSWLIWTFSCFGQNTFFFTLVDFIG